MTLRHDGKRRVDLFLDRASPPDNSRGISRWMLLSFLLHLVIAYLLLLRMPTEADLNKRPIEVKLLAQAPEPRDSTKKQIVDIPELAPEIKPDHARFLSTHNQRVEKETQRPRENPHPWQEAVVQGSGKPHPAQPKPDKAKLVSPDGIPEKKSPQETPAEPEGSKLLGRPETDFLPDVNMGEKTYLNAEAFKHTTYYLEIKRKIEIAWNPSGVLHHIVNGGISIQRGVLATYLGITLNPDGSLQDVVILRSSGVAPLDDEAVRTFRVSAPFTRAPNELLSKDGKLRFEFGFIVTS